MQKKYFVIVSIFLYLLETTIYSTPCDSSIVNVDTRVLKYLGLVDEHIHLTSNFNNRLKYEKDLTQIVARSVPNIILNDFALNKYSSGDILSICSIFERSKTGISKDLNSALRGHNYQYSKQLIERYENTFLRPLINIIENRPEIENLVSTLQGKKFNYTESIVYLDTLYSVVKERLNSSTSLSSFVNNVGIDIRKMLKDNPFIGISNPKRSRMGKRKKNLTFIPIYKSHLENETQSFVNHLMSNPIVFSGFSLRSEHIELSDVEYQNKTYSLLGPKQKTINAISGSYPEFKSLLNVAIDRLHSLRELSLMIHNDFNSNYTGHFSTINFKLSFDIDKINGKNIISAGTFLFTRESQNAVVYLYPDPTATDVMLQSLDANFKTLQELYQKPKLTQEEKTRLLALTIKHVYYLSKYTPYMRGSSGVARLLGASVLEKLSGSIPNLHKILFDLDAFIYDYDDFYKHFYTYPFMQAYRQHNF